MKETETVRAAHAVPSRKRTDFAIRIMLCFAISSAFQSGTAYCQTQSQAGLEALRNDRPADAIPALEAAIRADPENDGLYFRMGTCLFMLGRKDEAIQAYRKGAEKSLTDAAKFHYAIGNVYFTTGKYGFAEEAYSDAIRARGDLLQAWKNRAQARMQIKRYDDAVTDYREYLARAPSAPDRADIERLIGLLGAEAKDREAKIAAEKAREEAEAAQKAKLMNEIKDSLKAAAEDTKNLSTGADGAQGYDDEGQLAD